MGLDARNVPDIKRLPEVIEKLRKTGAACEVIFLQANDDVILSRFSETRRKHPLTSSALSLREAVSKERELLGDIIDIADLIVDTSDTSVYDLRELIGVRLRTRKQDNLSILIESFGYKNGLPADADFVFDVRCLPNPYWEPKLRRLNGRDQPVKDFLEDQPKVMSMTDDIVNFLERWIPHYRDFQRSYLTVAIGCTGGQHRSVYIAEAVAERLSTDEKIKTRHRGLPG